MSLQIQTLEQRKAEVVAGLEKIIDNIKHADELDACHLSIENEMNRLPSSLGMGTESNVATGWYRVEASLSFYKENAK